MVSIGTFATVDCANCRRCYGFGIKIDGLTINNTMVQLCRDIMYVVAEKMLILEQNDSQFRSTKASNFMFIDTNCEQSCLFQFSKFKTIDHINRTGKLEINLYKKRSFIRFAKKAGDNASFRVELAFLHFLIAHRRFIPEQIQTKNVSWISAWTSGGGDVLLRPTTPFQSLISMLKLEDQNLPEIILPVCNVVIYENSEYQCDIDLLTIFTLNAKDYSIEVMFPHYNGFIVPVGAKVSSHRTKDIKLTVNGDDGANFENFSAESWINMFLFIFRSCDALQRLYIRINLPHMQEDVLVSCFSKALHAFVESVLPAVFAAVQPSEDLRMFIQFREELPRNLSLSKIPLHNCIWLSNIGDSKMDTDDEISRFALFDRRTMALSTEKKPAGNGAKVDGENMEGNRSDDEYVWRELDDKGPGCFVGYAMYRSEETSEYEDDYDYVYDDYENFFEEEFDYGHYDDNDTYMDHIYEMNSQMYDTYHF